MTELDPARADLKGARKLLGMIPFGNKLARYFERYQTAQKQLDAIIKALEVGQDELRKDNAASRGKGESVGRDGQAQRVHHAGEGAGRCGGDPGRHPQGLRTRAGETLHSDALFPIRQRQQDLLTQLAVSVQGYLALDLVRKNNIELIKGVDRAQTTTVAAFAPPSSSLRRRRIRSSCSTRSTP